MIDAINKLNLVFRLPLEKQLKGIGVTPTGRGLQKRYLENSMQALFFDLDGTLH